MKLFSTTLLIIIVYFVGFIGLHSAYQTLFIRSTPITILLSVVFVLLFNEQNNFYFWSFVSSCMLIGFVIEVIGVATGMPFGVYSYGNALGIKLLNVPLIMAVNWLVLILCVGSICNGMKTNKAVKALSASFLAVAMDFFIEPVAIRYDFWHWQSTKVPLQNYGSWFTVSFLLLMLFYSLPFTKNNKIAYTLYLVQFIFFILMTLF